MSDLGIKRYLTIAPESGSTDPNVVSNSAPFTHQGIPYMWGTGDIITLPSNETKITASNGSSGDYFGWAVSTGCGKIVTTANWANIYQGEAYVYDLDGSNEIKITASDGGYADFFGNTLATGCGKIVVGTEYKTVGSNSWQGAIYIYDVDGTNEIKVTASDGAANARFGSDIAVGCGKIVVAAVAKDVIGTLNGQPYTYNNSGGFYIYDLDGTNEIIVDDPYPQNAYMGNDYRDFAETIAIGCGRIAVSDPAMELKLLWQQQQGGAPVDDVGGVYVYDLQANLIGTLTPHVLEEGTTGSGADNDFGEEIAIADGLIVIGSPGWNTGSGQGAVYVFDVDLNPLFRITASDGASGDSFGSDIAVGSGRIVIGANSDDDNGTNSGSVYVYDYAGNLLEKIHSSDNAAGDAFGSAVDINNGKIVVGAFGDASDTGAIYTYDTPQVYSLYDLIDMEYGD